MSALVLLDSATASSSASVTLGAGDWDTNYNVYLVTIDKAVPANDSVNLVCRLLISGTPDSSASYDHANYVLKGETTFADEGGVNANEVTLGGAGTGTGESVSGNIHLFKMNVSGTYKSMTFDTTYLNSSANLRSKVGGAFLTNTAVANGITIFYSSGNIASGEFKLYGYAIS
tara:strand:+ start:2778 stop:3296 length:519 start_codon:yes stop_codon:yes gene_type:complete